MDDQLWQVDVGFAEDHECTRAEAVLQVGDLRLHGYGRARRHPHDQPSPIVGEELAAARALWDLAHKLVDTAGGRPAGEPAAAARG